MSEIRLISGENAMLEVKVPSEIRDFKGRHMGLTTRQIISVAGSLAVGIPLGVFGGNLFPADIHMWAVMLAVSPIIAWGFAKYKGMRFEEFMKVLFKFNFLPQKRVYEDTEVNYFSHVKTTLCAREIQRQRINSGELDEGEEKPEEMEEGYD
jgi:hypothetical protein